MEKNVYVAFVFQNQGCLVYYIYPFYRHAESRDHATIGRGNIFRLRKDKDWITVEYVEMFNFIL